MLGCDHWLYRYLNYQHDCKLSVPSETLCASCIVKAFCLGSCLGRVADTASDQWEELGCMKPRR